MIKVDWACPPLFTPSRRSSNNVWRWVRPWFVLTSVARWRHCRNRIALDEYYPILRNTQHVLHNSLLPPPSAASQNYGLRSTRHDRQLLAHTRHLTDCEFITRIFVQIHFINTRYYSSFTVFTLTFIISRTAFTVYCQTVSYELLGFCF